MSGNQIVRGGEAVSAVSEFENYCGYEGVFCSSGWLKLWDISGFEAAALLYVDGSRIVGYFPFCIRKRLGQTECYSMPDGMYGGAIAPEDNVRSILEKGFIKFAEGSRFSRTNIVEFSSVAIPAFSAFARNPLATHVLDLREGIERIKRNLPDGHRSSLSKAEKQGLEIREARSERDIDEYWKLLLSSAARRGLRPRREREFYSRLRHCLPETALVWQLAVHKSLPCAGHIYVHDRKSAFYWDACSNQTGRDLSANHYLLWHSVQRFVAEGFESLNLGASPGGATDLARFKARWGGKETEYYEYDRRSFMNRALAAIGKLVRR